MTSTCGTAATLRRAVAEERARFSRSSLQRRRLIRAIVYRKQGSTHAFESGEIEKPIVGDSDVLVRVRATSINPIDYRLKGDRPGRDVAGEVEAVGGNVTRFKPGDEVFGACRGALAEYACAAERALVVKPANVTFEQAASVPVAGLTALQGLRDKGRIQPGEEVLVNGAAGGVGTFAVQIAKSLGASVTGVCSTRNVEMVRSIGADRVVDYTREDFTRSERRYDLVLDCVGNHPLRACRRVLRPDGVCVIVGGPKELLKVATRVLESLVVSRFWRQKFVPLLSRSREEDLTFLRDLLEVGKLTPVIDRRYALNEVPEAIRYHETGHARGKGLVIVGQGDSTV